MIGMSNAQIGSSADLPFEPSLNKQLSFTNGQGIKAGELCVVMSHDMTVEGSHGTQLPGSDFIVPSAAPDGSHTLLGAIGKPHLVSAQNKIMQAFYLSNINLTAASGQTVPTGNAALTGATYMYSVHWDSTTLELGWNTISPQLTYSSEHPVSKVAALGAFAWGEPYQIDDDYWLLTGQFSNQAGPFKDKRNQSWYYPGQVNLVKVNSDTGEAFLLDNDYCIGLANGTTTNMTPISSYVPTGKPFVVQIKEDIGFKQVYEKPSVNGIVEKVEGDVIASSGVQGYKFVKEYTFIYVYNCHAAAGSTAFTIQARPFTVSLWSEETVFPQTYRWENRTIPNTENGAKLEVKEKLALYGLEFIEDAEINEHGVRKYQSHYDTTMYNSNKKVKHHITFDVYYDETVSKDYAYHEVHEFSLNTDVEDFTMADIEEMKQWSQGGNFTPLHFTVGDDNLTQYTDFDSLLAKLRPHMSYLLAFISDAGIDCGNGQVLYGNYCNFSNLDTQHVMFLTSTPDTVATAHATYTVYHLQYDANKAVWTTTPAIISPTVDESLAQWAPGVTCGLNNTSNRYGYNPYNKYYTAINSQRLPLVLPYYNNLNCDNVITSADGKHKYALFPHYYYDSEVDWKTATVKMTIKAYKCEAPHQLLLTKHWNTYGVSGGSVTYQQSTANYIPDSGAGNNGGLANPMSQDWDILTGNVTNSYCFNTKITTGSITPMVYKMSDTGYAMSYLAPVCGYPGWPVAFGSTRRAVVVKLIYFIEELNTFYSPSQYGLIADAIGNANAAVTSLWSSDVKISGQTDYFSQPGSTVPAYPEAVYCRPLAFLTSDDYLQFHTTRVTGSNYYNGCANHTATPLSSNAKSLLVYPVTSIMENQPATATTYQKPILYGVAQNTIGTAQDGELLQLTGKVKLHTFLVEDD